MKDFRKNNNRSNNRPSFGGSNFGRPRQSSYSPYSGEFDPTKSSNPTNSYSSYRRDDRGPRTERSFGGGERREFGGEKREFNGERKDFGGERREFKPRRTFGSERSFGGGERREFGGEKREFNGERKDFGGERREFKPRRDFGRSNFEGRNENTGEERRSFGGGFRNRRFGNSGGGRRFGNSGGGLKRRIVWSPSELVRLVEDSKVKIKNAEVSEEKVIITNQFTDFGLDQNLLNNILELGYVTPTPIQDKSIPMIMEGKDIVGLANTGTGKTAAFLIPLIDKHLKDKSQKVLIVTPTRELAEQINKEFMKFTKGMRIGTSLCIGGTSIFRQVKELKYKPNFVIGTPGRLKDLINREILDLKDFKNVVLDEADQMLEIGFVEEVKFLVSKLAKDRQSLFFSATTNKKVNEILSSFVQDPITISVLRESVNLNVSQDYLRVPQGKRKSEVLFDFLSGSEYHKVIVFGQTKHGVEDLANHLVRKGLLVESIHGDKRQNQRKASLMKFKGSEIKILIATDVVSRGIDISDVSHVINYDLPRSMDEYIHRIGRTGRAGKKGLALTLID